MRSTVVTVAAISALVVGFAGCNREPARVEIPAASSATATNAPVAERPATNEFAALKGKWQRGDGDYLLEIRSADAAGKLDAGYFNPTPINVSQARATRESGDLKVFVELRDANYPGCTYKLTYDAKSNQLFGQYFQAAMQQTYDVAFGRMK
jgi:hypothetical protein